MSAPDVEALFTDPETGFRFARWGRPVVPVVFGAADESIGVLKGAIEAVVATAGHSMAETDPELGANLMVFFMQDWQELAELPNLGEMVPDLPRLLDRLAASGADQYRFFRFDSDMSIKASFVFIRMGGAMAAMPAADLGLEQAMKSLLSWSPAAFSGRSALATIEGRRGAVLRPDLAAILNAAYDPVLPVASEDPVITHRIAARARRAFA
ncbi:hypothetical protein [Pseudooceanicola aestuarii]|uniref:hypothetical protein n=1 Tax=Pseudooceanicola aestuarii TaxID=2697319 RepID=UPI0013D4DC54